MSVVLLVLFPQEICFRIFVINEGIGEKKKAKRREQQQPPQNWPL